jgi:hypothetical protein
LPDYEEKIDKEKKQQAVFYHIVVTLGTRKWELWKRYSQFD